MSVMFLTPDCTGRLSRMPELNWMSAEAGFTSAGDLALAAAPPTPEVDASEARNVEPSIVTASVGEFL